MTQSHSRHLDHQARAELAQAIAELWTQAKAPILARVGVLEHAAEQLVKGTLGQDERRQAAAEAHKLAGVVGSYGFWEVSRMARELEVRLRGEEAFVRQDAEGLLRLALALREALDRPAEPLSSLPALPDKPPLLLVLDADPTWGHELVGMAESNGLRVRVTASPDEARALVAEERPDVFLFDPDASGEGYALASELVALEPPVHVVVTSHSQDFCDRLRVAQLGGSGFLPKPLPSAQALATIGQLLKSRLQRTEASVLAVDDDPHMLTLIGEILTSDGLKVTTLDDPLKLWDALEETVPHLLLLDVHMPAVSGLDLCRMVRHDPRWSGLPILFLTAHGEGENRLQMFAAGADDYISKPILGPELTTRIRNRLERTQLHRTLAETDPLTGLSNRHKFTQSLHHYMRLSNRHGQPLSVAVLDLDHFKHVNDAYGHGTGDLVLRRVADLLRRMLRREDEVARWGGEEIMVALYGANKEAAVTSLTRALTALRAETFESLDGERFGVTFSAGIAQFGQEGDDLATLYRLADERLYRAKQAGRNRVEAG